MNGKIYSLKEIDTRNVFYIGSTINILNKRLSKHKYDSKIKPHINVYQHIENIGGFDNISIELIQDFTCESIEELRRKEGEYILQYINDGVELTNKNIAGRTVVEYYMNKRDEIIEYKRQYNEDHRDELQEQSREYYIEHIEQSRHHDKLLEQMKNYRETHRDEINQKQRDKRAREKLAIDK